MKEDNNKVKENIKPKRLKEKTDKIKAKIIAVILAVATFLGIGAVVIKKHQKEELDEMLSSYTTEDILDDKDFKINRQVPNLLALLKCNGYDVDNDLNNLDTKEIYTMYECAYGLSNAQTEEEIKLFQEGINNNLENFISSLENLISSRVSGNLTKINGDVIVSTEISKTNVVITDISKVKNEKNIITKYYDEKGNVVSQEEATKISQLLPVNVTNTYNIKVTDKDMLVVMTAIENKDNKNFFTGNNLYKIISAAIRISCKDYITVYDNMNEKNVDYVNETQEVIFNATINQNENTACLNSIDDALNRLKEYAIKYNNLDIKIENTRITTIDSILYLIDDNENKKYKIDNEDIIELYNDIVACQEKTGELKNKKEETIISEEEWLGYTDPQLVGIEEIDKKIRIKK